MTELHVYVVRYADGYQEVRFFSNEEVVEAGGAAAIEADLREAAMWFYPLGRIKCQVHGNGDIEVPMKTLGALMDAWKQHGSPKRRGMAISEVGPDDANNVGVTAWHQSEKAPVFSAERPEFRNKFKIPNFPYGRK
jgi:hypothetical protein